MRHRVVPPIPRAAFQQSALVLAVVLVGVVATVGSEIAAWAINAQGSYSAAVPASPERVALDLTGYYVAAAVAVAAYVALVALAVRGRIRGVGRTAVLAAPIVLQVLLWLPRPWFSTDALSYLAQGYVGAAIGGSAYTASAREVLGTDVGAQLTALGWRPQAILSPYGPLWTAYETLVMLVTRDIGVGLLLIKLPVLLAALGSAALVWRILGMVRPRLQLVGMVVFLWNPVVLTELSAEGHVDGVMMFLVLLGLFLTLRRRIVASAASLTLAALVKYIPVLLAPPQLVFLWRTSPRPADVRRRLLLAGAVAAALLVASFAPFWAGLRTLEGLRVMGQPGPWPTVTGVLYRYLERSYPGLDGGAVAGILITGGFLLYLGHTSLGVRDARSLLAATARIGLAWVLVASPVFYPWYAVLPIALVALAPEAPYVAVVLALTVTGRVVAPLVDLRATFEPIPAAAYTLTSAGLVISTAVALAFAVRAVWTWAEESPTAAA